MCCTLSRQRNHLFLCSRHCHDSMAFLKALDLPDFEFKFCTCEGYRELRMVLQWRPEATAEMRIKDVHFHYPWTHVISTTHHIVQTRPKEF